MDAAWIHALVRISACVGIRDEVHLERELKRALKRKVPVLLIREAILQSYLFAGYAAAINAFIVLNRIAPSRQFLREGNGSPAVWKRRGKELCRRIYDDQYHRLLENMNSLHPDLAEWMIWEGYGKVLSRPFLSPMVRELLIAGMTAVLGTERQFHSHVRGALHVGATPKALRDVLRQVQPWMSRSNLKAFVRTLEQLVSDERRIRKNLRMEESDGKKRRKGG